MLSGRVNQASPLRKDKTLIRIPYAYWNQPTCETISMLFIHAKIKSDACILTWDIEKVLFTKFSLLEFYSRFRQIYFFRRIILSSALHNNSTITNPKPYLYKQGNNADDIHQPRHAQVDAEIQMLCFSMTKQENSVIHDYRVASWTLAEPCACESWP